MSRRVAWSARRLLAGGSLVLAWCALWGDVSAANLLSGLLVVLLLGRLRVGPAVAGPVRLVPLVQFTWFVLVDLVVSTGAVAREILTPTDSTEEAIIAVAVPASARRHLLLLLIAITVTPGTAVVDTDGERGTLYLHLLHCDRQAAVTAHIDRLAALAGAALPPPDPTREVPS